MAGHLTQLPTPLIQLRPAIPPELSQTLMRCLEKRPSDRWQSAEELLAQLESLATPGQGTTPMVPPPLARRSQRRAAWVLAGAVFALIAVMSLALQGRSPASREFPLPRRLTFQGDLLLASISPDGKSLATLRGTGDSSALFVEDLSRGAPLELLRLPPRRPPR